MSKFINLKTDAEKPVLVDASTITAIEIYDQEDSGFRITSKQGQIFDVDAKRWGIDLQDVLKKMEDAGFPLVAVPGKHGDRSFDGYFSPAAVTTITISKARADGAVSAKIGLEGVVHFETTGSNPQDIDKLIDATKAQGKNLLYFGPADLSGSWYREGNVFINPDSIRRLEQNRDELQVMFDNAPYFRGFLPKDPQDAPFNETLAIRDSGDKRDLQEIFAEVKDRQEKTAAATVQAVVSALTGGNDTLVRLPGQNIYVRPSDFAYVQQFKTDDGKFVLGLQPPRTAGSSLPEMVRAYYNTEAERQAAFEVFSSAVPAKPSVVAPAPKSRLQP